MPSKTILGIDNGLSGCLAFYDEAELMLYDMPVFEGDRKSLDLQRIKSTIELQAPDLAYIEKLTPMPKVSGLTGFSMGHSEGAIRGILTCMNIPYVMVRPAVWKKFFNCPAEKDQARAKASELLPQFSHNWPLKRHDGRAEAGLIALYGMYQEKGKINL